MPSIHILILAVAVGVLQCIQMRPRRPLARCAQCNVKLGIVFDVSGPWMARIGCPGFRLELFFKSSDELQHTVLPFLRSNGIKHVNVTNKDSEDPLIDGVKLIQRALPDVSVCVHYSLKYNYVKSVDASFAKLQQFCNQLTSIAEGSSAGVSSHGTLPCEVLLVSGGGKKKKLHSVKALELLKSSGTAHSNIKWHVAFNPYLRDPQDLQVEKERLLAKLQTGLVAGIYLQMGTDLARLEQGLQYIEHCIAQTQSQVPSMTGSKQGPSCSHHQRTAAANAIKANFNDSQPAKRPTSPLITDAILSGSVGAAYQGHAAAAGSVGASHNTDGTATQHSGRPIAVLGSIFIPSKRLLAQMRFRPWNGVFLSEEYLSGVDAAVRVTQRILEMYAQHNVVPLVESPVKTTGELRQVHDLLSSSSVSTKGVETGIQAGEEL